VGRVVAERQRTLLGELDQLRRGDEVQRDQAAARAQGLRARRDQALAHLRDLQSAVGGLMTAVLNAGQLLSGAAGRVPAGRLPQTTGDAGQCTWYAEQAWVTYSDPASPTMRGDGADVVPNLAQALGRAPELLPQPGALVSWQRPLMSAYGHVAYVASVARDGAGTLTGYTVWEMNYQGAFMTDVRYVQWAGPSPQVLFLSPPAPVDPVLAAAS
jgi:surface antigen